MLRDVVLKKEFAEVLYIEVCAMVSSESLPLAFLRAELDCLSILGFLGVCIVLLSF